MTKYILHGGETGVRNEYNKEFYQEWVKTFDDAFVPTILLVYFARPKENWEELKENDKEKFNRYNDSRQANFVVASDDLNEFKQQVVDADVVYVRGGPSDKAIASFKPIVRELRDMLNGKVYAGSSAGVMFLAHNTRSHTSDWKKGLGILPFNAFVHWSEDFQGSLDDFKKDNSDNDYEFLLIPETEFVVKEY